MGPNECKVQTAPSVHILNSSSRSFEHTKHAIGFSHLFLNVYVPTEVGRKCHTEFFLRGNVQQSFTVDDIFSYKWTTLSCDAEHFAFLGVEFESLTLSLFLHVPGFCFKDTGVAGQGFNNGEPLCVVSKQGDINRRRCH